MKTISLYTCGLLTAAVTLYSCGGPTSHAVSDFDLGAIKKQIDSANASFSAMFAKGDSVGIANLYAQDAKFMDAGAPAVAGRKAIQSLMSGFIRSGASRVDFKSLGVYGCDSLVAEEGELKLYAGAQQLAEDKYIVLWKKEGGQWKIFRDISNSNHPAK